MKRKLSLEQLESRNLCAVVTKLSSSGTLSFTGDASDNVVTINGSSTYGSLSAYYDGAYKSFTNVKNVTIDLKGNNDSVTIFSLRIDGNLKIKGSTGNDQAYMYGASNSGSIRGTTSIDLGKEDNDFIRIDSYLALLTFNGSTTLSASDIRVTGDSNTSGVIFGNLTLKAPSGSSLVNRIALDGDGGTHNGETGDIHVYGNLSITSSAKTKLLIDDVNVRVDPATNKGGNVTIKLSGYDDRMYVNDSYFAGTVKASFGAGNDSIKIHDTIYAGKLNADGGSGTNKVYDDYTVIYPDDAKTKNLTIASDETISFGSGFPFN